jgi:virginiamycin B lyase
VSTDYATWIAPGQDGVLTVPAVAADGTAWAGDLERNTLLRVHAETGTVTSVTLPVADPARSISLAAESPIRVWFTQEGRHALALFDLERRTYQEYPTPTPNSSPFGLARDGDGRLWFTELTGQRIGRFDPATETFTEYELPGEDARPYLLAIAADGRVWFTLVSHPAVGVLDPMTGQVTLLPVPGLIEGDGTTGIAVAGDGRVWFGTLRGTLGSVDPATQVVSVRATPAATVYGVAVAPSGLVWFATLGQAIYAFDPRQQAFCSVQTGADARWLAAGEDGSVWVTQGEGSTNALGRLRPERAARACGTW